MKRVVAALALIGLAATLFLSRPRARPEVVRAETRPAPPSEEQGVSSPSRSAREARALAVFQSRDKEKIRALAAEWRRLARKDTAFVTRLCDLVSDSTAAPELRTLAAVVLGSLPDPRALEWLARALESSTDPAWSRTLLLALGSDRSSGDDDEIFGLEGSPRTIELPLGLAVRIRGPLDDASVRSRVIPRLLDGGDADVRWAAALALTDSVSFEDVRKALLEALPGEADPAAQGQLAKALSDWAAVEAPDSPERARVVSAILEGALRPDGAALRLRSEDGLKRMAWTGPEVLALASRLEAGSFDERRWAIAVLAGAMSRPDQPAREAVRESLSRVAMGEPDPKVRELAVTGLSYFRDHAATSKLLIGSLGDPAWHVRAAAVRALGRMRGSQEILDALQRSESGDSDERVRRAAAEIRKNLAPK